MLLQEVRAYDSGPFIQWIWSYQNLSWSRNDEVGRFATGELSEAQKKFIEEQEEEENGNDNHKE